VDLSDSTKRINDLGLEFLVGPSRAGVEYNGDDCGHLSDVRLPTRHVGERTTDV
jgi:hypothetical protein